jgi:UDP-N-acetylglucosamine 2-epimerase (non-hydrolysing)
MRVMSVVGARPQFVKLASIVEEVALQDDFEHLIVHTGQHYDPALSDVFFRDLAIPRPDEHLNVGSGTHGVQTGRILAAMDPVLERHRPDVVLVYGDTNSTLAATIAAVKLHVPVAHLEAGLRSFNRRMPEEHNRVLVDHAADLLLAPTQTAVGHLEREGLGRRVELVGDVMTDLSLKIRDRTRWNDQEPIDRSKPYVLATIHRAENTDDAERLKGVIEALRGVPERVILLVHPRLRSRAESFGIRLAGGSLTALPPLSYPDMVRAVMNSVGIVTDSGGLQKEAYLLGVPCTTLRSETEWVETLDDGWNVLDPALSRLRTCAVRPRPQHPATQHYGDGHAAGRVMSAIRRHLSPQAGPPPHRPWAE